MKSPPRKPERQDSLSPTQLEGLVHEATTSIGLEITIGGHSFGASCTGFLVAVDLIATCAHALLKWLPLRIPIGHAGSAYVIEGTDVLYGRFFSGTLETVPDETVRGHIYRICIKLSDDKPHVNYYFTSAALEQLLVKLTFNHLTQEDSSKCLTVSIPLSRFYGDLFSLPAPDRLSTPFVLFDEAHDVALIQLSADCAQWDIVPLTVATGWIHGESLFLCGCPYGIRERIVLEGTVGMSYLERRLDERSPDRHALLTSGFHFASRQSLDSTTLEGLSGGPVVASDGYCIGIEVERLPPRNGAVGTQFQRLVVTPVVHLQRLMEHRLRLNYRSEIFAGALATLREKAQRPILKTSVLLHDQDLEISRGLRRMLRAMEEVDDDLRLELSLGQDVRATGAQLQEYDPGLDVIIIGLSQWANPAQTSKFLDSLTMARDAHVRNGALLVYFRISPLWSRDRKITHCGFDVSEQHPISLYSEADRLAALTRIILRIHRLLKTHKYEQNLLER